MTILTAFCDLQFCPVSYDFVTWLVIAARERDRRGCDALHVVLVPNEGGLAGFARHWGKHDEAATRWRLWHIIVASCPLADATVTVAPSRFEAERMREGVCWWPAGKNHFMGVLVDAARKGEAIPKLRATEAARRYVEACLGPNGARHIGPQGAPLVTFTLRQQDTDPARNSNAEAWGRICDLVRERGMRTIWMDDVHVAMGKGESYAADPDIRLAIYERAAMNMIGNNGPQELLKFSEAPYLAFGQALTDGWKDHFRRYFHLEPGEQLPWAGKNQRLVYERDSFEVLQRELTAWASATH